MAKREILTAPDPRLKKVSTPVDRVDDNVRALMDDMLETMYAAPGIGLDALQVGVLNRVIVVDIARDGESPQPLKMANPEIIDVSDADNSWEEGCLSVPDHYAEVVRPAEATVRFLDADNEVREARLSGLLATVVQHEIDHLDGILFIDRLSSIKRNMILRKLIKARKLAATPA